MEPVDAYCGHWVKGETYTFENRGDVEKSGRRYLNQHHQFNEIKSNCKDSYVPNYFTYHNYFEKLVKLSNRLRPIKNFNSKNYKRYFRGELKLTKHIQGQGFVIVRPNNKYSYIIKQDKDGGYTPIISRFDNNFVFTEAIDVITNITVPREEFLANILTDEAKIINPVSIDYETFIEVANDLRNDIYKEGRRVHYYEKRKPFEIVPYDTNVSPLMGHLSEYNGKEYQMSSLICSQFSGTGYGDPLDIVSLLNRCPPASDCDPCTKIGSKISKSLIHIAALRIFSDPAQSILEIPVNSVDAYNPASRVGKFGMGFFSFLYWLIDNPHRLLKITSIYKDDEGRYCCYSVNVREDKEQGLVFSLTTYPYSQIRQTGTIVELTNRDDGTNPSQLFTRNENVQFMDQMKKLDYMENANIYFAVRIYDFSRNIISLGKQPEKFIYVGLERNRLICEDYATGIPIDVVFNSLFVPSISTKTVELSTNLEVKPYIRAEIRDNSKGPIYLYIIVNGVAVYITKLNYSLGFNFIIRLPPTTKIPVSRDDFIMTESNEKEIKLAFTELVQKSIDTDNFRYIDELFSRYIKHTSLKRNSDMVLTVLSEAREANRKRLVPSVFHEYYNIVYPPKYAIASRTYDWLVVERNLEEFTNPDKTIWEGVNVVMGNFPQDISFAGTQSFLFIDEKYMKSLGKDWIETIETSMFEMKLERIDNAEEKSEVERVETIFWKRYRGLDIMYANIGDSLDSHTRTILQFFKTIFSESNYIDIIKTLLKKFNTFKGDESYGAAKARLDYKNVPNATVQSIEVKLSDNAQNILKDIITRSIWLGGRVTNSIDWGFFNFTLKRKSKNILREIEDITEELYSEFTDIDNLLVGFVVLINLVTDDFTGLVRYLSKDISQMSKPEDVMNGICESGIIYNMIDRIRNKANYINNLKIQPKKITTKMYQVYSFSDARRFTVSQLMYYLFENNVDTSQTGWLKNVGEQFVPEKGFQSVGIAINEGTTKAYVPSILTELVQNSVDVNRSTFKDESKRIIKTSFKIYKDGNSTFTITDNVGMDLATFISLSIPFLSTKKPSELVTGEMGSGFFNIYRECLKVMLVTRLDGVEIYSLEEPIRSDSGRVIDVRKSVNISKTTKPNITNIVILLPRSDNDFIVDVNYYMMNVIGTISRKDSTIFYNNKRINLDSDIEPFDYGDMEVRVLDGEVPSMIHTKGIPLGPLSDYIGINSGSSFRATNIVVNIKNDSYIPSQARTSIRFSNAEIENKFNRILEETNLIAVMTIPSWNRVRMSPMYIDQLESKASLQALGNLSDYGNTFMYQGLSIVNPHLRIVDAINTGIDYALQHGVKPKGKDLFHSGNRVFDINAQKIIDYWFKNKKLENEVKVKEGGKTIVKKKIVDEEVTVEHPIKKYIIAWIETFCEIAKEQKIAGYQERKLPIVRTYVQRAGITAAYYRHSDNSVNVNVFYFNDSDVAFLEKTVRNNAIKDIQDKSTGGVADYFKYGVPSAILAHELEHYRRRSEHTSEGVHSITMREIFPGEGKVDRTFVQSTNVVHQAVLKHKFYVRFMDKLR